MNLSQRLTELPDIETDGNLLYQKGLIRPSVFEKSYLALREKEDRVYTDKQLKELPDFSGQSAFEKEWRIRNASLVSLIKKLSEASIELTVLELGCGNGWLSNQLAKSLDAQVLGMDINETELYQAAKAFKENQRLTFLYADIFSVNLNALQFDKIILASAIQYFPNLKKVIHTLIELLKSGGEVHILDTPLYSSSEERAQARQRSMNHFNSLGSPDMASHYYHHQWSDLAGIEYETLFNPKSILSRINRIFSNEIRVFPWIVIKKQE